MRALVIDDARAMRLMLKTILEELGFQVFAAADGLEALDKLKIHWPIDIALVDWHMPNMDGAEFIYTVRANEEYDTMRLVMVTTEADEKKISEVTKWGVNDYVHKPFDIEQLIDKLKQMGYIKRQRD
jgi:two-component system, chemotaxis family, chemotaxis protein CheY